VNGEILHAVIAPTVEVIYRMTDIHLKLGHVETTDHPPPGGLLMVNVSIIGEAKGFFLLGVEPEAARLIASRMFDEEISSGADSRVASAILELANIIAGNAVGPIAEKGITVTIEPPVIVHERAPFPPEHTVFVTLDAEEVGTVYVFLAFRPSIVG
jgi:CheY-specific phosphatase CheX